MRRGILRTFPLLRASYRDSDRIQQKLARSLLDLKAAHKPTGPIFNILAFEMSPPVYTCGRRQIGDLSPSEIEYLRADGRAEFVETLRGGHTTWHGPGQVTLYPVLDLAAIQLKARDYICQLEGAIIDMLSHHGIQGKRTKDPGVWLDDRRKIASIGFHIRRSVTSHGIGMNVGVDPFWFGRIVACNLPHAQFVSMNDLGANTSSTAVASELSRSLAQRLNMEFQEANSEEVQHLKTECRGLLVD